MAADAGTQAAAIATPVQADDEANGHDLENTDVLAKLATYKGGRTDLVPQIKARVLSASEHDDAHNSAGSSEQPSSKVARKNGEDEPGFSDQPMGDSQLSG